MEIKVNDYVRTQNRIFKITKLNDEYIGIDGSYFKLHYGKMTNDYYFLLDTYDDYETQTIYKSSPRIIDLIEVGDVLIIKDFVDDACMIFTDIYLIQNETQLLNIKSDLEKKQNKKLYSIVTKEMFEQIEYKIN